MSNREMRLVVETGGKKSGRPIDAVKRQAIVDAAAASFFDVGFAATSIEKVAAAANVSKVTIYTHFNDKNGLFSAAVEKECANIRSYFSIDMESDDAIQGTIGEKLRVIANAVHEFLSRPEMVQFDRRIAAETEHEPAIGQAFLTAGPWRMKAAFAAFLAHADSNGELNVPDPGMAAEQLVSMCKGMGDLERRFGAPVDEEHDKQRIECAIEVFLKVYAPSNARLSFANLH